MVALRIVLIVCCILLCLLNSVQGAALQTIVGTINRVSDGDSVTALSNNNAKLRIRLFGIDAPEVAHDKKPGQPYGNEARDYRGHLIGGKPVRVDAYGRDGCGTLRPMTPDGRRLLPSLGRRARSRP